MNYILKKIFLPKESRRQKYLFLNAVIVKFKEVKYTMVQFAVEVSDIKDNHIGYVILDGYIVGDKLNFLKPFVGKKLIFEVETGRSQVIMNKRIIKSIEYKRKVYGLSDCI